MNLDTLPAAPQAVLQFWFHDIAPAQWWQVDPAFDRLVEQRFGALHRQAVQCELFDWRADPRGRLAEVIVLDQFSRNLFRGDRRAFEADPLALALAQEAVAAQADAALAAEERAFLYMPYMHSESRRIHEVAETLFRLHTPKHHHDFELRHRAVVERFGRYPHRNAALGRESTPEELAFLTEPGSRF
jgi:uncharacterized protein (DUF924 family)